MRIFREWLFGSLILIALCFLCEAAFGVTWYVDTAGGSRYSTNMIYGMCNGQSSAAYPGTTNQLWAASTVYATSATAKIIDSNGDYEAPTTGGTSGASAPTWPAHGSSGVTTVDGGVTWTSGGAAPVNQPCAFNDIRYLWADGSYNASGTFPGWGWVIAGGDTVIVDQSSDWRIGYSGPGTNDYFLGLAGDNNHSGAPAPPNGTSGQHTQIFGINHGACTSAAAKTKVHGGYGVGSVFNLGGVSYVDIACFDITDWSTCGRVGAFNLCQTSAPVSDYANQAIGVSNTTTNTTLTDLNIHGMANQGIGGPTGDGVTVTNVVASGNAAAGWNMDPGDGTTGTGHLTLTNFATILNGCNEVYPISTTVTVPDYTQNGGTVGQSINCADDSSNGYGDGIGTATVNSSPAWLMTLNKSVAIWNTQDGFDLLHLQGNGSSLTASNNIAYGNMGQQLKVGSAGNAYNNYLVGNCNALRQAIPGEPAVTTYSVSAYALSGPTITAWSISGNVATFTASNTLTANQVIVLAGFGTSTFFNGVVANVLSTGLSSTQFEINFTHANGSATESGNAWDAITFTYSGTPALTSSEYIQTQGFGTSVGLNLIVWQPTAATSTTFTAAYPWTTSATRPLAGATEAGSAFTGWNAGLSDYCRAGDEANVLSVSDGTTSKFDFNTILSANATVTEVSVNGTCTVGAGSTCLLDYRNNVVLGFTNNTANGYPAGGSGNNANPMYFDAGNPLTNTGSFYSNNSTHGQRASWTCPQTGETNAQCGDPGLTDETWHLYDIGSAAPAVTNTLAGHGVTVSGITTDINGSTRANPPTIGAYEVVVPPAIPVGGGTINGRIAALTWTPSSTPNTTVNVYRCAGIGCTNFTPIASGQTSTNYSDSTLSVGDYSYYVTAVANGKESKPSNTATVSIHPQPPSGLIATVQ